MNPVEKIITDCLNAEEKVKKLEKQLAESIPRSKIEAISGYLLVHKDKSDFEAVRLELEKLLKEGN
jgi:hypothetical protein